MTTALYERVLRDVQQLSLDERRQLRDQLDTLTGTASEREPSGAALLRDLDANPPDPEAWAEIERIIEENCERIDPSTE